MSDETITLDKIKHALELDLPCRHDKAELEWLVAEVDRLTAERDQMAQLLERAQRLLKTARSGLTDPGLSQQWGRRRKQWRDDLTDFLEPATVGEPNPAP